MDHLPDACIHEKIRSTMNCGIKQISRLAHVEHLPWPRAAAAGREDVERPGPTVTSNLRRVAAASGTLDLAMWEPGSGAPSRGGRGEGRDGGWEEGQLLVAGWQLLVGIPGGRDLASWQRRGESRKDGSSSREHVTAAAGARGGGVTGAKKRERLDSNGEKFGGVWRAGTTT